MSFVYGIVPSRRLGRSLGVSPIPFKLCNYSCIYCQLGRTHNMTNERKTFFPPKDIIEKFENFVKTYDDCLKIFPKFSSDYFSKEKSRKIEDISFCLS